MTFDKETRQAIAKAIENGISAKMEVYEEEWVTDAKLCELLPAFTLNFLKRYGDKIPRERLSVVTWNGTYIPSKRWMYPLHKIKRMVSEGQFREIKLCK